MSPANRPTLTSGLRWFLPGLALIHAASAFITLHRPPQLSAELAGAAALTDLTLTTALLFWWTLGRRGLASLRAGVIVIALNLLIARAFLPLGSSDALVWVVGGLAGLAELTVAWTTLSRLHAVRRAARVARLGGADRLAALEIGLREAVHPTLAAAVATEVGLIALGLFGWFRRAPEVDGARTFSTTRRAPWGAIVAVILLLLVVESAGLHLLLRGWSEVAAVVHLILAVYGAVWLVGDYHALRLMPVRLDAETLHVLVGLRWRAAIPRRAITAARLVQSVPDAPEDASAEDAVADLHIWMGPMVLLELDAPVEIEGPFGLKKRARRVVLSVDQDAAFVSALAASAAS